MDKCLNKPMNLPPALIIGLRITVPCAEVICMAPTMRPEA